MTTTSIVNAVNLTSTHFEEALIRYLDETKPDPLAKKQVEGWTCEWTQEDASCKTNDDVGHEIRGTLAVHGDYMTLLLQASNRWTWEDEKGELEVALAVRARFRTVSELKKSSVDNNKVDKKVRAGVLKRLKQDDYISKLLIKDDNNDNTFVPLCQATILRKQESELEERVWMDQDLLESIRRCVYSQADSILSVVEFLTAMPYFDTPDCSLGHRAKLRLLEDAMVDACEREEEEELIDELSLGGGQIETNNQEETSSDTCDKQVRKKKRR